MAGLLDWMGGPAGTAVGGLLGGILGSNSSPASTTSRQEIDPVVKANVYKQLAGTSNLYDQQMAQGGLNDVQKAGLQQQLNVYSDPSYNTGFQQMRSLGSGLLGQPIAGNPFTNGTMADGSWRRGLPSVQSQAPQMGGLIGGNAQSYMPTGFDPAKAFQQATYTPPPPAAPSAPQQTGQQSGGSTPMARDSHSNAQGGESDWDRMGDVEKAQYYADNPTMAKITQLLQLGFSLTDIAKLQNQLDPGFVQRQQQIAQGDAFGGVPNYYGGGDFSRTFDGLGGGDVSQLGVSLGGFGDAGTISGLSSDSDGGFFGGGTGSSSHSIGG